MDSTITTALKKYKKLSFSATGTEIIPFLYSNLC